MNRIDRMDRIDRKANRNFAPNTRATHFVYSFGEFVTAYRAVNSADTPYISGRAGSPSGGTMRPPGSSRMPLNSLAPLA